MLFWGFGQRSGINIEFRIFNTNLDFFQGYFCWGPISTSKKLWMQIRKLWSKIWKKEFLQTGLRILF